MLAVILGAVACLATSKATRVGFRTSAYLVNATLEPREIRIFRARGPLDCGSIAALQSSALASVFDPEIEKRYYMTYEGGRVFREYLRELAGWQPAAQLLG
jgi:hypothetical protein